MSVTSAGSEPATALALGVVLMIITQIAMPDFFRGRTLTRETRPLVLDETRPRAGLRLPVSEEGLVIGPDAADRSRRDEPPGRS
jgi:hypothetical protein